MKILYVYRSRKVGPSIRRVFESIEKNISEKVDVDHVELPYIRMLDIWKNIKYIISVINKETYDIIHITGDVYYIILPLYFIRKKDEFKIVVTVHDLGHYTQHKHTIMHFCFYWLWIRPLALADHITFISNKSREEAENLLKLDDNKLSVVYNSYKDEYVYSPERENKKIRILHIGTGPNKNLENVVKAIKGMSCHLRIIKKLTDSQIQLLNDCQIDYSNAYDISDEQMLEEYKQCDLVSFPSLYEGFGMPIIEAQAVGRIVVTSNREPMRSIAGNGAILVNPEDPDDIRKGFLLAIKAPQLFIERGLENCKKYSSTYIADQYYNVYRNLISCSK